MFKVLVVDDDPGISMFISRLLTKKFSCRVVTAANGLEGLTKVKDELPEVIFLDVTMPIMNGLEMLEALKQDSEFKNIPVIMLTAISDKNVVSEVMGKGVLSYLLKPLMFEVTYQKIKELFYQIKKEKEVAENIAKNQDQKPEIVSYTDKMLIVSTDENFRSKLRKQMITNYEIIEAENGADGLELFLKERPKLVCLGDKLPVLNEILVASKIRDLTPDEKIFIFLITENTGLSEKEKQYFDIIIPNQSDIKNIFSGF